MLNHKCLQFHLSTVRWESYKLTDEELDSETWQRYQHNLQLCQGLYVPLHLLEISLRNHLQTLLQSIDKNWYSGFFNKGQFKYNGKVLSRKGQEKLSDAINKLTKNGKSKANYVPTEGQIVAELTFGFWVELFSNSYGNIWGYTQTRGDYLKKIFPKLPNHHIPQANAQTVTNIIYPCLKVILFLRNRIFHHEPIWHERHFDALSKQMPGLANQFLNYKNEKVITFSVIDETLHTILGWLCEDLLQDAHTFRKA